MGEWGGCGSGSGRWVRVWGGLCVATVLLLRWTVHLQILQSSAFLNPLAWCPCLVCPRSPMVLPHAWRRCSARLTLRGEGRRE